MNGDSLDSGGDLVFRAAPGLGRLVGGAALTGVGGWLATQLVRGIMANRASTHAAWSAYVPAVLMFGGVSMAFLLPGALMLLYRREVRVDRANRQVVERQTYLGLGRTRCYPLASFKKIVVGRRQIKRRRSGRSIGSAHARRSSPY